MEGLKSEVIELIYNDWLLDKFRQNLQRLNPSKSAELIVHDLENLSSKFTKKSNSKRLQVV